jgi:hypothetical protein
MADPSLSEHLRVMHIHTVNARKTTDKKRVPKDKWQLKLIPDSDFQKYFGPASP